MSLRVALRARVDRTVATIVDVTRAAHDAALGLQRLVRPLVRSAERVPRPEPEIDFTLDEVAIDEQTLPRAREPSGPSVLPPFEIPRQAPLEVQLQRFADSVMGATGSYAAFIADTQGLPIVSRNGSEDQIALTAAIDRAMVPIRESLRADAQGSIALEIDRSNVLQAIWVNTPMGRFAIGLVLPQSLGGEFVESIRAQFLPLLGERGTYP